MSNQIYDGATDAERMVAVPQPVGSWSAVVAIGFGTFSLITAEFMPVGLLPSIAHDMGITEGHAGLALTISGIVAAVVAPTIIGLAWRVDRRQLLMSMLVLLLASNLAVSVAPNFWMILFGRVLLGAAIGGFWTIAGALGPRMRPGANAGIATAIVLSGVSLGTVAGVPAGATIGAFLGWRPVFGISAALTIVVLGAVFLLVPSLPSKSRGGLQDLRQVIRNPHARFGIIWTVVSFLGQFAGYTYITPFLLHTVGIVPQSVSAILFGFGLLGVAGNMLGGWAVGRSVRWALVGTLILLCVSVALLVLAGARPAVSIPLLAVWGLAFGMQPIVTQSWVLSAAPDHHEGAQSLLVSTVQISIGSGSLIGGLLFDHFGADSTLLLAVVTAGLSAAMFARRPPA